MDNFELNGKPQLLLNYYTFYQKQEQLNTKRCFNSDASVLVSLKSNTRAEQIVNKGHRIFHLKRAEKIVSAWHQNLFSLEPMQVFPFLTSYFVYCVSLLGKNRGNPLSFPIIFPTLSIKIHNEASKARDYDFNLTSFYTEQRAEYRTREQGIPTNPTEALRQNSCLCQDSLNSNWVKLEFACGRKREEGWRAWHVNFSSCIFFSYTLGMPLHQCMVGTCSILALDGSQQTHSFEK